MRTTTLGSMRASAGWLVNLPAFTTTTSITTADANDRINEGIAEMFVAVVGTAGTKAYEKAQSFTLLSNSTDYALPLDFYQLRNVICLLDSSGSTRVPLTEYPLSDEAWLMSSPPSNYGDPMKYRLLGKTVMGGADGGSIRVLPAPSTGVTLLIEYIFAPVTLANDGDTLDGFAGFEDYGIVFAARRFAMRTEQRERAAELGAELERIRGNVLANMRSRDGAMAPRVNMTRTVSTYGGRRSRWG